MVNGRGQHGARQAVLKCTFIHACFIILYTKHPRVVYAWLASELNLGRITCSTNHCTFA